MLVIGARARETPRPSASDSMPAERSATFAGRDEIDPVDAEIQRTLGSYHAALTRESVCGEVRGVTVHMRLDGTVTEVEFAERVPLHYDVRVMGELVVEAINAARELADLRRKELMEDVTFFGEPALSRARQMIDDPQDNLSELSAVRYW